MASSSKTSSFQSIKAKIQAGDMTPIYLLYGEEGYYIDALTQSFEESVAEADRDFNLYTLYAPEVEMETIMDTCRRYPMMSDRLMVIVKECQAINANQLNKLRSYASQPSPTTVLVISCRGAKSAPKELEKAVIAAGGTVFVSERQRNVNAVIENFIRDKGLNIEPKGLSMLSDYVGNDLSRIYNEIDKLTVALPQGATVTPEAIERHIGMSKDFNNFELISALASRNAALAFRIAEYFKSNPKNNPFPVTISVVWNFFSNLLLMFYSKDKSDAGLCAQIGLRSQWVPTDYKNGMRNYNAWQLLDIIHALRRADCATKGIDSRMDPYDILHDLIFRILSTTGKN